MEQGLLKGEGMFEISEEAQAMVKDFFAEAGGQKPIRILFTTSACDQPALGMALSDFEEGDKVFDYSSGGAFVVEQRLYDMAAPIQVGLAQTLTGETMLHISCQIAENTCTISENPDSCRSYCMGCTCQDEDPLAGLSL